MNYYILSYINHLKKLKSFKNNIDELTESDSFRFINMEYDIKCQTIEEFKNIYNNLQKIFDNPYLVLSDTWDSMTITVIDKIIDEYIENYILYDQFKTHDFFILINNEKYYLGLHILKLDILTHLSNINNINEKNIKMLKKFQTNFYTKNILPIYDSLQEKINRNLISIITQYHITDISKNKIESILTIE